MCQIVKILAVSLILGTLCCQNPMTHNPTFDSYNDLFSRGAKNPGFWGAVGPTNTNVFDSNWNNNGFQQMYNLNSQSPLAGARGTGFDTTTTMFNQYGPTSFEVIPVQSNFMPQSRINAYTYDLNEPRMSAIYKNYVRFMGTNLDRLSNVLKGNTDFTDLNQNAVRKLKNPKSFEYKNEYFDGFDLKNTMPAYYSPRLTPVPQTSKIVSERKLVEAERKTNSNEVNVERIKRLKENLQHIERKLELLESFNTETEKKNRNILSV